MIVQARAPHRVDEAMRAALGLTLRGAAVAVRVRPERLTGALARRAAATLTMFGHEVGEMVGRAAEAVEVWTEADSETDSETETGTEAETETGTGAGGGDGRETRVGFVLHLVRRGGRWEAAEGDWVVDLEEPPVLRAHGAPPLAPGALQWRQLRDLIAAAALVITW